MNTIGKKRLFICGFRIKKNNEKTKILESVHTILSSK
jgi:hypothetical protein